MNAKKALLKKSNGSVLGVEIRKENRNDASVEKRKTAVNPSAFARVDSKLNLQKTGTTMNACKRKAIRMLK